MEKVVTTSERVYLALRQMIIQGELAPGSPLVQRKLAAKLGVSNIPIVEATRRLERDGLVDPFTNTSARVRVWTDQDILGAYLAREALEGVACRLFVRQATDADRHEVSRLATEFDAAAERGDLVGCVEADLALHNHIVRVSNSRPLIHVVESTLLTALILRNAQERVTSAKEYSVQPGSHDGLVMALQGTDPDAAEEAGREHVRVAYVKHRSLLST